MIFYHISENIYDDIDTFIPRVPLSILKNENSTKKRICIAKSIKDCLSGLNYHTSVNYMFNESEENESYVGNRIIKVYEFDINEDDINLLNYKDIRNYVPDSLESKEYWYLNILKPKKSYMINIVDYDLLDNNANILDKVKYELIMNLKSIPVKAKVVIPNKSDKNNLLEMIDLFNNQTVIKASLIENMAILNLRDFPLTIKSYEESFKNKFNWFDCEISFFY